MNQTAKKNRREVKCGKLPPTGYPFVQETGPLSTKSLADKIEQSLARRAEWYVLGKQREKYVRQMSVERYNFLLLEDDSAPSQQV